MTAVRLISSQEVLVLPILAAHLPLPARLLRVVVADGLLDGRPARAVLNGHHKLIAARWRGVEPVWEVERAYADEALFRAYLAELAQTAEHPWYFLEDGAPVEPPESEESGVAHRAGGI